MKFIIENFAEEEMEYNAIITSYNDTSSLYNFGFFKDFFKNNISLYSKSTKKGKGKYEKTIVTLIINEECFSQKCLMMVYAQNGNFSKYYDPKIINNIEKYVPKTENKTENTNENTNETKIETRNETETKTEAKAETKTILIVFFL